MPVEIDITIFYLIFKTRSLFRNLHTAGLVNRTLFLADVICNLASMQSKQVGRLTGFHADHRPNRTCISYWFTFLVQNGKITVGKQTVYIFYPCLNAELFVSTGHFLHFYRQTRKHPCIMVFIQCSNTESAFCRMKSGTVQQMIT